MSFTHWKKLTNPKYLGAQDLTTDTGSFGEIILTISKVSQEIVKGPDGKEEQCIIGYFTENMKPIILNKTNCKVLTKLSGSPFIEKWSGVKVAIGVKKVKAFGEVTDALRILEKKIGTDAVKIDYSAAIKKINDAKSIDELKDVYSKLSSSEQSNSEVIASKDKKKGELK